MSDNTKLTTTEAARQFMLRKQAECKGTGLYQTAGLYETAAAALAAQEQVAAASAGELHPLLFAIDSKVHEYAGGYHEALRAANAALAIPSQNALSSSCSAGWVPVSERLPPYNKRVLLWWVPIDGNKYAECVVTGQRTIYDDKEQQDLDGVWYWANGRCYGGHHVTAWCEQPPPYTATKGDA